MNTCELGTAGQSPVSAEAVAGSAVAMSAAATSAFTPLTLWSFLMGILALPCTQAKALLPSLRWLLGCFGVVVGRLCARPDRTYVGFSIRFVTELAPRRGRPDGRRVRNSAIRPGRPCWRAGAAPWLALQRDLPEREPALELGFDRQLVLELGLELELALVVARLVPGRGHERVVLAALEVVDEVDGLALLVLEREHGGQQPVAVAAARELGGDDVDRLDQVVEVGVAQNDPAVAELVVVGLDARAGVLGGAAQELLGVADDLLEVGRAERLEDDARGVLVLEPEPGLDRDVGRDHREDAIRRGPLQLLAPAEQGVEEAHPLRGDVAGAGALLELGLDALEALDPLLHRRVRREQAGNG